jgi:hypothetical protein
MTGGDWIPACAGVTQIPRLSDRPPLAAVRPGALEWGESSCRVCGPRPVKRKKAGDPSRSPAGKDGELPRAGI